MEPENKHVSFKITLNIAAVLTAIISLVGMFFLRDTQQQTSKNTELIQESAFNVLKEEIEHNKRDVADLESHLKDLSDEVYKLRDKVKTNVPRTECATDNECKEGYECQTGKCIAIKALPEAAPAPKIDDFNEIKNFVQKEQAPIKFEK